MKDIKSFPDKSGVYIIRGKNKEVIYVGKAVSLKKRIFSYFREDLSPRMKLMIDELTDIDYIITDSENEALILENNLIKKYHPKYNIKFRDDKTYPYIKITSEEFPKISITRKITDDNAKYFGPYSNTSSMRETINLIRKIFLIRNCNDIVFSSGKPCLNFQIKRCSAPCAGKITKEDYNYSVNGAIFFLEGKREFILKDLYNKMEQSSDSFDYESAIIFRDKINAIEKTMSSQKVVSQKLDEEDIIGISFNEKLAYLQIFFVREGKLIDQSYYVMEHNNANKKEILSDFLKQFYIRCAFIPKRIILSEKIENKKEIENFLSEKKKEKVYLSFPKKGEKKNLLDLASKNAEEHLKEEDQRTKEKLDELKKYLNLPSLPLKIEAYDISNISGKEIVGSSVVFYEGKPKKDEYRRFKVKTVQQQDDYASLKEIIKRRFTKNNKIPDLVLIDGGKGQLNSAVKVIQELNLNLSVVALAKEKEEIFIKDKKEPIILPPSSAKRLLQHIRDEAHRFAISYHRKLRRKKLKTSILNEISGVGEKTKNKLLKKFGSIEELKKVSLDELEKITNKRVAKKIYEYLQV